MIDELNEVKIRKAANKCRCKICDNDVSGQDIVYLRSFRLQAQPFHICIHCWKEINKMVDDYLKNDKAVSYESK